MSSGGGTRVGCTHHPLPRLSWNEAIGEAHESHEKKSVGSSNRTKSVDGWSAGMRGDFFRTCLRFSCNTHVLQLIEQTHGRDAPATWHGRPAHVWKNPKRRDAGIIVCFVGTDLASFYGVGTRELNQVVSRNPDRFPADFALKLTLSETQSLMFQLGTSTQAGGTRHGDRQPL